jgi:class 3 adenylate cyclase
VRCPSCQHDNRPGASFCESCGTRLEPLCAGCGNALRASARFCDACGRAVPDAAARPERTPRDYTPQHLADRILTTRSAIEGERKHVTVLFADVADYSALGERVDPEELHALMDRFFQQILAQVHRFEGTVNQFTGDGVMALFGAPLALEDAPRRAVRAALATQEALAALDQEVQRQRGRPFRTRIGIHTGPVVVGRIGDDLRMDYTAVGDTTNLAARLQQAARPGSVLISEATRMLVAGFFDLEPSPPLELKGRSGPVQAYQVRGELADRGRIEAAIAESGLTRFIGRTRELETLHDAFSSARQGRGQVVFVVGEAGIGKSRLLYEFRQRLAGEQHLWVEGRCAGYARDTAFLPIIDAMRRSFGVDDRDDDATAIARLERGVRGLDAELEWTLPFLRQLLSLPPGDERVADMDGLTRRSETHRAIQELFVRVVKERLLVFAVEDLHWLDPASEQLLGFLSDAIPASRALFLLTHRPGYRHPFGDRSYHVRITLQPLSPEEAGAMASALLETPELPESLARLIARKTDGNPFFVEEVTKTLLDDGVVRRVGSRVELARELDRVSVPDSIHDVLMARIDRLSDEPKRAIQVASVIGREFALRLWERIAELGERAESVVGELRALELIYQKAVHPELAFMFKHALTHDVAYESVLMQRRRVLHRLAGAAIEELYADRLAEHYEALAHHFTRAEEWERALHYHECAARKAAAAFANEAATAHCHRALDIAEKMDAPAKRRIAIEQLLGRVNFLSSDFALAGQALLRAADLEGPGGRRAMNRAVASSAFLWAHDYERSRVTAAQALEEARRVGSRAAESTALSTQSLQRCVQGDFDQEVFELGLRSGELAKNSGSEDAKSIAEANGALWLKHVGEFRRAARMVDRMPGSGGREASLFPSIMSWVLGLALGGLGEYARALAIFREGVEVSDRVGQDAIKCRLLNSLGWLLAEIGAHETAAGFNRSSTILAAEMVKRELVPGAPELYANSKINLAGNLLVLGDVEAADAELAPVADQLARPGDPWMRWRYAMHLLDAQARVALARGDSDRALALLDEERTAAGRYRARKVEARALELRGRTLAREGQDAGAEEVLRGALAVAREIEYPPVQWRALSLLGELERRRGRGEAASALVDEARALVERLAAPLPEPELQRRLRAVGEQLATDPLVAYR